MKFSNKINLSLLALVVSSYAGFYSIENTYAGTVSGTIPYNTYLDFAQNGGIFSSGQSQQKIVDIHGKEVGIFPLPMIDLAVTGTRSVANFSTLIGSNQIINVAHNFKYNRNEFSVSRDFKYRISQRTPALVPCQHNPRQKCAPDYAISRFSKLVTEVAPIEYVPFSKKEVSKLSDPNYYSPFLVRSGFGVQYVITPKGNNGATNKTFIEHSRIYPVAGILKTVSSGFVALTAKYYGRHGMNFLYYYRQNYNNFVKPGVNDTSFLPLKMEAGDSGSGLFVYDVKDKKWKLLGTVEAEASGRRTLFNSMMGEWNKKIMEQHRLYVKLDSQAKISLLDDWKGKYRITGASLSANNAKASTSSSTGTSTATNNSNEDLKVVDFTGFNRSGNKKDGQKGFSDYFKRLTNNDAFSSYDANDLFLSISSNPESNANGINSLEGDNGGGI